MEKDAQANFCQLRIVVAPEGVEIVGAHFGAAIAAPQIVFKEYRHLLHHCIARGIGGGSHLECRNQVFFAIGSHLANRQLRAGDNHGFTQIFEHKTQCRRRKRHRVGAVKHHKSIVGIVVVFNGMRHVAPMLWAHVAAIDGRIELDIVDVVVEQLHFRHIFNQM